MISITTNFRACWSARKTSLWKILSRLDFGLLLKPGIQRLMIILLPIASRSYTRLFLQVKDHVVPAPKTKYPRNDLGKVGSCFFHWFLFTISTGVLKFKDQVLLRAEDWILRLPGLLSLCPSLPKEMVLKMQRSGVGYEQGYISDIVVSSCMQAIVGLRNKIDAGFLTNRTFFSTNCSLSDRILQGCSVKGFEPWERVKKASDSLRKIIFFPVLRNFHYILLVFDSESSRLILYDSISNPTSRRRYDDVVTRFVTFLEEEFKAKVFFKGHECLVEQTDDCSCGACVCFATESICFSKKPHIPLNEYRCRMAHWLLSQSTSCHPVIEGWAISDKVRKCVEYGWLCLSCELSGSVYIYAVSENLTGGVYYFL